MAENPVAKFRRVFREHFESGKYEPLDVAPAVRELSMCTQVVESWTGAARCSIRRSRIGRGRAAGFDLWVRAVHLADSLNELLEVVRWLANSHNRLNDAKPEKRAAVYRTRYAALGGSGRRRWWM